MLDAGALTVLVARPAIALGFRRRGQWPPVMPAVVLTEALTGDHRRDFGANRLLRVCIVATVDGKLAREAARLRAATGRAGTISAVDALVAAFAAGTEDAVVLTSDPADLRALAEHVTAPITVVGV